MSKKHTEHRGWTVFMGKMIGGWEFTWHPTHLIGTYSPVWPEKWALGDYWEVLRVAKRVLDEHIEDTDVATDAK